MLSVGDVVEIRVGMWENETGEVLGIDTYWNELILWIHGWEQSARVRAEHCVRPVQ